MNHDPDPGEGDEQAIPGGLVSVVHPDGGGGASERLAMFEQPDVASHARRHLSMRREISVTAEISSDVTEDLHDRSVEADDVAAEVHFHQIVHAYQSAPRGPP